MDASNPRYLAISPTQQPIWVNFECQAAFRAMRDALTMRLPVSPGTKRDGRGSQSLWLMELSVPRGAGSLDKADFPRR